MNTPLSMAVLLPYPLGRAPSQRYRFEQWAPHWPAEEIRAELLPFADESLMAVLHAPGRALSKSWHTLRAIERRRRLLPRLQGFDLVVVHRAAALVGPPVVERAVVKRRQRLVFDFDDAIYILHTSSANRRLGFLKHPGKTHELARISHAVTVGNRHLAEFAAPLQRDVTIIPSSVDTERYRPPSSHPARPFTVGWTGSATSQQHLEDFAPQLADILQSIGAELRVHSDRPPRIGTPHVWRPWSADTEVFELEQFDVGIMPTPDDPFARGKGAMKALLYMAMGTPVVSSRIPASEDLIVDGVNGFLAGDAGEWRAALSALAADPALRRRIGDAGRTTVQARFSARSSASLFARVAARVCARA